jgi:hypothetical protein
LAGSKISYTSADISPQIIEADYLEHLLEQLIRFNYVRGAPIESKLTLIRYEYLPCSQEKQKTY